MWTPCFRFCTALVAALLAAVQTLQAATFSANPVADAYTATGPANNLRDNNYGAAGALSVSAPGSPNGEFQSVLRFDFLAARSSFDALFGAGLWTVQSVSLQLNAVTPQNAVFNPNAAGSFNVSWMQNDSWVEGTGGNNTPSTVGLSYNSLLSTFISGADQALGTFSYDGGLGLASRSLTVASGLRNDIQSGGVASLRLFAADATVSYLVNSRNFGAVANQPLLTVSAVAVPEPAAFALVFTFLALLGAARLCRRKS